MTPKKNDGEEGARRRFITPAELAAELGVSELTLWRWRRAGTGPAFVRVGPQAVRYARESVERWIAENERMRTGGDA